MSIRSDLLMSCILGNRWRASSTPAAGTTVSAQSPVPTHYDSRVHLESLWYSINNLSAVGVTVSAQVRSASQAGTVLASVAHYVPTLGNANVAFPNYQLVAKRGVPVVCTMDTVVSSVVQCMNAAGWIEDVATNGGTFDATYIRSLSPKAWFRFNVGNTVSQWTDQSGNGNHLLQATVSAQPTIASDGSYVFDGVAQYLKCNPFTLNQPTTYYVLMQWITFKGGDRWVDGNSSGTGLVFPNGAGTAVAANAGSTIGNATAPTAGTMFVISATFNGTSSAIQINNSTAVTGSAGAGNMGGLTVGAIGGGGGNWSNIQVKEVIVFPDGHDAPTRARVISYLKNVGQLSF